MAQTKNLMKNQTATGPGAWHHMPPELSNRGYIVSVGGIAGTVSATVNVEVDNNDDVPATRLEFKNITGIATLILPVSNSDVDPNAPFPRVRLNVISLTPGASVSGSMTGAYSGMGAA